MYLDSLHDSPPLNIIYFPKTGKRWRYETVTITTSIEEFPKVILCNLKEENLRLKVG